MKRPVRGPSEPASLPLELGEHHLLQVLLSAFELRRIGDGALPGAHLTARFDATTESIWRRQQRRLVQASIDDFAAIAADLDRQISEFRGDAERFHWRFSRPPFVFRYGNGGTLPIIRLGDREYYCLAYRDIPPIGWNLANGASDSRYELLNPLETIERELREELLVIDPEKRVRYVLQWEDERALERPEFAIAREFWRSKLGIDIGVFEERIAPVTWIHGPDAITIECPGQLPRRTSGVFLNVSAADFGIEVDRVAKIHVEESAIVLDGETYGSTLVDRPVGLFEVDRFTQRFWAGEDRFAPDILFCSGERTAGRQGALAAVLDACASGKRPLRSPQEDADWESCAARFDLCPVARQLVHRHLEQERRLAVPKPDPAIPYRVFISATGHEVDQQIARRIREHLEHDAAVGPVFFYTDAPMSMDWLRTIEGALISAESLIVVCTDVERVRSLDFEWQPFFLWTRYKRKHVGRIVPVVHGLEPYELPLPLCAHDAVDWSAPGALTRLQERVGSAAS